MMDPQAAFFAKLPKDSLLPLEVELRSSLLRTAALTAKLFPSGGSISIQDWVEHRMQSELVLRVNAKGRVVLVSLVGNELEEDVHRSDCKTTTLGQKNGLLLERRGGVEQMQVSGSDQMTRVGHKKVPPPPPPTPPPAKRPCTGSQAFLNSLPADTFTTEENNLRDAVLSFLCGRKWGEPATLAECSYDLATQQAQADFLPAECPLMDWIRGRVGAEVEVEQNASGCWLLQATQSALESHGNVEDPDQEDFFDSLPHEAFTEEEEILRAAIETFLHNWASPDPPTLSDVGTDVAVSSARNAFFPPKPKGERGRITIRAWLYRRLPHMFDLVDIERITVIGWKGTVDHEMAIQLVEQKKLRKASGCDSTTSFLKRHPGMKSRR